MRSIKAWLKDKYNRIEVAFFIFYYFLFGILTDIEVQLFEPTVPQHPHHIDISTHIVNGIITVIPLWVLYKVIIQKYLFEKKYWRLLLWFGVYVVLLNFYNIYINWLVAKLTFLPADIIATANHKYNLKTWLHLGGIMYTIREYMVLAFLAYFIRYAKQEQQMNQLKQQQLQAELKYLKVQLQPHFFFNTLNNIYALTLQQSDKAAPLVARHSEMMRYILYNSSKQTVALPEEIAFLKNYVEVEAVRYPENINISFETQGINNKVVIEPLLLLPFIENTFKHGIREEVSSGYVHIVICLVENELTMETRNSKAFLTDNSRKGVGLGNAERQLNILYSTNHTLELADNKSDFEVRLTLNLKYNG